MSEYEFGLYQQRSQREYIADLKARIVALEKENAALREAQTKYRKAMDDIYNHNEAARAAVVEHFGLRHSTPTTDKGE